MSKEIILKRAKIGDIDKFMEIEDTVTNRKFFAILPDRKEAVNDAIKDIAEHFVYFIEKDGEAAGTAAYELKDKNHAYLFGVVVKPEFQRRGIAKQAAVMILEKLKNITLIDLVVHPESLGAIKLYESLGFEKTGERTENHFGDGEPRIRMVLKREK